MFDQAPFQSPEEFYRMRKLLQAVRCALIRAQGQGEYGTKASLAVTEAKIYEFLVRLPKESGMRDSLAQLKDLVRHSSLDMGASQKALHLVDELIPHLGVLEAQNERELKGQSHGE